MDTTKKRKNCQEDYPESHRHKHCTAGHTSRSKHQSFPQLWRHRVHSGSGRAAKSCSPCKLAKSMQGNRQLGPREEATALNVLL